MAVHRGFDIGNHFCEWCYCYDNCDFPYFTASLEEYPSRDQQVSVMLPVLFVVHQYRHTGRVVLFTG